MRLQRPRVTNRVRQLRAARLRSRDQPRHSDRAEHDQKQQQQGHRSPMMDHGLTQHIQPAVRPSPHGPPIQPRPQIITQIPCTLIPPVRLLGHRPEHDRVQLTVDRCLVHRWTLNTSVPDLRNQIARWHIGVVRQPSGQRFVQQQPERIDISPKIGRPRAGADLLGCRVHQRAQERPGQRREARFVLVDRLGQPEIKHTRLLLTRHDHIARLDVPMDHRAPVCVRDRVRDLTDRPDNRTQIAPRSFPLGPSLKVLAGHELHDAPEAPIA